MRRILAILAVIVIGSGCLGAARDPSASNPASVSPTYGSVFPLWQVGQRWTWALSIPGHGDPVEVTTTVSRHNFSLYYVGIDSAAHFDLVYPLHLIPLGIVDVYSLAWFAHGSSVRLLNFPLGAAKTSIDLWLGANLSLARASATILEPTGPAEGYHIEVDYPDGAPAMRADYSPRLQQFTYVATHFGSKVPFASARLATASMGKEVFDAVEARDILRKKVVGGATPAAPFNFTVPNVSGHVLTSCAMGGGSGVFSASVNAPDGWTAQCSHSNPAGEAGFRLQSHRHAAVPGSWTLAVPPPTQGTTEVEAFFLLPLR